MKTAEIKHGRFVDELFHVMREQPFRDPSFDAIRSGRMPREAVKLWALQTMLVVRHFTRFISAIHANCADRDAQMLLAENLWEEHGRGNTERDHFSLAKRLARSLGASDEEIENFEPLPETTDYINYCLKVTREASFIESMAAIGLGIEYFMPQFFGALAEGLRSHYGLTAADVQYLSVHVSEDQDHSRRSIEIIEKCADTDEAKEKAKQALREMLAVKRGFAEALYERMKNEAR
ncbi:MAG TPA: iron-containing redox enzyme family protein [Blastocatellia bacterium]|jgi:pyrroloquinoline-quinone synthase|nr:iron-containing redox enzyme family protein [Blastocatellia bacterium]